MVQTRTVCERADGTVIIRYVFFDWRRSGKWETGHFRLLSALLRVNRFARGGGSELQLCDQSLPVVMTSVFPACVRSVSYNYTVMFEGPAGKSSDTLCWNNHHLPFTGDWMVGVWFLSHNYLWHFNNLACRWGSATNRLCLRYRFGVSREERALFFKTQHPGRL